MGSNHNEHVLELRFEIGNEWQGSWFLKYHRHDVVANVAFPRELLAVIGRERQKCRDVEHELVAGMLCVHRIEASGIV